LSVDHHHYYYYYCYYCYYYYYHSPPARSKGYAFIEFVDSDVAEVVAETMNGYLLERKKLVCHIVPREKIHDR